MDGMGGGGLGQRKFLRFVRRIVGKGLRKSWEYWVSSAFFSQYFEGRTDSEENPNHASSQERTGSTASEMFA